MLRTSLCFAFLCSSAVSAQSSAIQKSVVVSFQPYYTLVNNISGGRLEVTLLLLPGVSPHTFDPRPSDVKKVSSAGIAFMNGGSIDEWLLSLVKNSGSKAKIVRFQDVLEYDKLTPSDPDEGKYDPHIWLDVRIMEKAAKVIGEELARFDAPNAGLYHKNATLEVKKLETLHAELLRDLAPIKNQRIITFHGAWTYFSRTYGPQIAASIEPFPGKEPSARYIVDVVKLIRVQKVKAVFAEPTLPEGPARSIAENAGVKLYVLSPEGTSNAGDYYAMMRLNKKTLLEALK